MESEILETQNIAIEQEAERMELEKRLIIKNNDQDKDKDEDTDKSKDNDTELLFESKWTSRY